LLKQLIGSVIVLLALNGCASYNTSPDTHEELSDLPVLEDFGPAPELTNETWLNTAQPLRLENLRGKVVLLEMWTFG